MLQTFSCVWEMTPSAEILDTKFYKAVIKSKGAMTYAQAQDLIDIYKKHYAGSEWVAIEPATENGKIDALGLNGTNKLEIRVFANEEFRQAVVVSRLDNLGKGASGAAVQNLKLMLGL